MKDHDASPPRNDKGSPTDRIVASGKHMEGRLGFPKKGEAECGLVVYGPTGYLTSIDILPGR